MIDRRSSAKMTGKQEIKEVPAKKPRVPTVADLGLAHA